MSERLLQVGFEAWSGRIPLTELSPLLAELAAATERSHEEFADAEHPELSAEGARFMLKALARLEGSLESCADAVAADDRETLGEALGAVQDALGTIRGVQAGHAAALQQGPAFHPFLNRVLLHLGFYFRGGQANPATRHLLAELPEFLDEMDVHLGAGEGHQWVALLEKACLEFGTWLNSPNPERLAEIQSSLWQACQGLSAALGARLAGSGFPPAEAVLLAVRRDSLVEEAVARCTEALERFSDLDTAPALAALAQVRQDPQAFAAAIAELMAQAQHESVLDLVSGEGLASGLKLPPLLSGLLAEGERYLAGSDGAELERGVGLLEDLLERAEGAPGLPELAAAAESLRGLVESRERADLEAAQESMLAAAGRLPYSG